MGKGRRGHHQRGPQIILKAPHTYFGEKSMLWRETLFLRVPGVRVLAPCWCGSSTHELVAAPRDLLHFFCSTPAHPLLPWPIFSLSYNTYPYLECKVDISFLQQTIKLFPETTPFYPKLMNFNTICKLCETKVYSVYYHHGWRCFILFSASCWCSWRMHPISGCCSVQIWNSNHQVRCELCPDWMGRNVSKADSCNIHLGNKWVESCTKYKENVIIASY